MGVAGLLGGKKIDLISFPGARNTRGLERKGNFSEGAPGPEE